jgi:hypothetical protein
MTAARALRVAGVVVMLLGPACGGAPAVGQDVGVTPRKPVGALGDWPPAVDAAAAADAVSVDVALRSPPGSRLRVRAYLVARTPPCPACNVTGQSEAKVTRPGDRIGKTGRTSGPEMPGCVPCPPASATISDEAAPSPATAALRAIGGAEGLQARHVGHAFVLTGTLRADAEGPALDVTEVQAVEGR